MWSTTRRPLPPALRLTMWTDGRGDERRIAQLTEDALAGGVRSVMVREHALSTRGVAKICERLLPMIEAVPGAVLLVNGHVDIAAAGLAHGVHCNARSLDPAMARQLLPEDKLVGFSAHNPQELDLAATAGCDYATLSPLFPTVSKPGSDSLGAPLATEWTAHARLPVIWLGGIDTERMPRILRHGAVGVAVMSALTQSTDVRTAASAMVRALEIS